MRVDDAAHHTGSTNSDLPSKSGEREDEKSAREALARRPSDPILTAHLCLLLIKKGEAQEAADTAKRGLEVNPSSCPLLYRLSQALEKLGDKASAIHAARQAISAAPAQAAGIQAELHAHLSKLLLSVNDASSAVIAAKEGIKLSPNSPWLMRCISQALLHQHDYDNALAWARAAAEKHPAVERLQLDYIDLLIRVGRFDEAASQASRSLEAIGDSVPIMLLLSRACAASGNSPEAIHWARRAAVADPRGVQVHRQLVSLLLRIGEIDEAARAAEEAVRATGMGLRFDITASLVRRMTDRRAASALIDRLQALAPDPRMSHLLRELGAPRVRLVPVQAEAPVVFEAHDVGHFMRKTFSTGDGKLEQKAHRIAEIGPIRLVTLHNVTLHVFEMGFAVFSDEGEPYDCFAPALTNEYINTLRSRSISGSFDSLFYAGDVFRPNNFAHWVVDYLPRVVFAASRLPNFRIGIPHLGDLPFQRGALAFFSIDDSRVARLTPGAYTVRHFAMLTSSGPGHIHSFHGGKQSYATEILARLPTASDKAVERIYLDRSGRGHRNLLDRASYDAVFRQFGIKVVDAGALPFSEQVTLMRSCSHVIGAHGAALANISFCRPETKVLEIFPPRHGTFAFALAAHAAELSYSYCVGSPVGDEGLFEFDFGFQDFSLSMTRLQEILDSFF